MASILQYDEARARALEATYATPDIAATRIAVFRAAAVGLGDHALDVGCGPGYLTRDLGVAVGPTGAATGVDVSAPMLALAARRCEGLPQVRLVSGDALHLPVDDASIDVACVVQVYCYVADLDAALADLHRAVRSGGRVVVLDSDFSGVVWQATDRARLRRILDAYDAHAVWSDLPRVLPGHLRRAGFDQIRCEAVPILTLRYHPGTYIYGLARSIREFVVGRGLVTAEDADAWLADLDGLEARGEFFFSLNRFMFVARRGADRSPRP
jgi:ubiquinone/menaquinone biosynthesis C-methylase UbiE